MVKRPRASSQSWWENLKDQIVSNGGFLHPSIVFDEEVRRLYVDARVHEPGKVLMKIPTSSILSQEYAISQIPNLQMVVTRLRDGNGPFSPVADVLLAMALAKDSRADNLYLRSLPESSSFDALPWRWPDQDISRLLGASPLKDRVQRTKAGVRQDFESVMEILNKQGPQDSSPVNFEAYATMLAVVSSRAFSISEDESVLVPILDLCDHCRGQDLKKNLSYSFTDKEGMVVKSCQEIAAQESLRLTYGAKGNAQLFLNYGFSIPNNVEPDGSCNDTLEFQIEERNDLPPIVLRVGPKSYTYGCLARAVESFYPSASGSYMPGGCGLHDKSDADDMEDFLNACDNEDDGNELELYGGSPEEDEESTGSGKEDADLDMKALFLFQQALENRLARYTETTTHSDDAPREYFASILLQSEQRTLRFYATVAEKLGEILSKKDSVTFENPSKPLSDASALIESQTNQLVQAFIRIRHDNLTS